MLERFTGRDIRRRLERDAATLPASRPGPVVTEDHLAGLPEPARRDFRFADVIGRPMTTSFRAHLTGRFRLRDGQAFMPAEIWQYNTASPVARIFWMRVTMAQVLPMVARDSYLDGRGHMRGKLLDLVTVADGTGAEFDIGELTTWLNDAVLMAPSMLLAAGAEFSPADSSSFAVSIADAGRTVSARVVLREDGAPVDFHTDDRFQDRAGGPRRMQWSTPIDGWQRVGGRALPTRGSAVWHTADGDFTYAVLEFAPDAIEPDPGAHT